MRTILLLLISLVHLSTSSGNFYAVASRTPTLNVLKYDYSWELLATYSYNVPYSGGLNPFFKVDERFGYFYYTSWAALYRISMQNTSSNPQKIADGMNFAMDFDSGVLFSSPGPEITYVCSLNGANCKQTIEGGTPMVDETAKMLYTTSRGNVYRCRYDGSHREMVLNGYSNFYVILNGSRILGYNRTPGYFFTSEVGTNVLQPLNLNYNVSSFAWFTGSPSHLEEGFLYFNRDIDLLQARTTYRASIQKVNVGVSWVDFVPSKCPHNCYLNGICTDQGKCLCSQDAVGTYCDQYCTEATCNYHGKCGFTNGVSCICDRNWYGDYCTWNIAGPIFPDVTISLSYSDDKLLQHSQSSSVQRAKFTYKDHTLLQCYDLGVEFKYTAASCQIQQLNQTSLPQWRVPDLATFQRNKTCVGYPCQEWSFEGTYYDVANVNGNFLPSQIVNQQNIQLFDLSSAVINPPASVFTVPPVCKAHKK